MALTSSTSQLSVLDLMFNKLGDQGLVQLCQALENPFCKLQELKYVKMDLICNDLYLAVGYIQHDIKLKE